MKVGKYSYPDWKLHTKLIETLQKMYGKFALKRIDDKNVLAKFLGHTGVTGGFLSKMAALRAYGLITGRGYVQVTELGKRIVHPEQPNDPYDAVKEAITHIPLWRVFYENYTKEGVELPDTDFWVDLGKIADLVPDEAKKVSNRVRNDYLADIRYLKSLEKPKSEVSDMSKEDKFDTSMPISEELEEFKFGNIRIWLPKEGTQEAWKKSKKMMDIYLGIAEED